ncbi:MAG: hypothetical protein M0R70_11285, partial [Nitrospirae bacterium]|nr:hypothetical protein [Nitrospirota bacterium]
MTATFVINTAPITLATSAGSGGIITPPSPTVNCGGSQTFTITPNACYHIVDVKVDGVSKGAITNYTISNVTTNHTIAASFALNTYTITTSAGSGGTITPPSATVNCGNSQTFTVTPNTGYHITSVTGCGGTWNGGNT